MRPTAVCGEKARPIRFKGPQRQIAYLQLAENLRQVARAVLHLPCQGRLRPEGGTESAADQV